MLSIEAKLRLQKDKRELTPHEVIDSFHPLFASPPFFILFPMFIWPEHSSGMVKSPRAFWRFIIEIKIFDSFIQEHKKDRDKY